MGNEKHKPYGLLINGENAYSLFGLRMDEGFIDTLTEPLSPKEYIQNESRLEDGVRIIMANPHIASREITLGFTIEGSNQADFRDKKNRLMALLFSGVITLAIPEESDNKYRLIYTGKGGEYSVNPSRTFCKLMFKFKEPNPANRS